MDRDVSPFGGAAGRVLWGAVSLQSLITGLVLGGVLFMGNFVFVYAKAHVLVTPFTQIVLALVLARFVLNGQYGEWDGTLFSGVGGTWASVAIVAVRYLLLTLLWLIPLMLFGLRIEQVALSSGMVGPKAGILVSLYIVASALSPPLFLIVSVTASDFGELFSPAHWRLVFGGRLVDLASIYAVYAGGVTMSVLLFLPLIVLGFQPSWKVGMFFLALAGCFMLGLALNLLGRLCGFYALGDFTCPVENEPLPVNLPGPAIAPNSGPSRAPTVARSTPTVLPERPPIQVSTVNSNRVPGPVTPPATATMPEQTPQSVTSPAVPAADAATVPAAASSATAPAAPRVLPALLDAAERIAPILKRFQQDPTGALRALEDLHHSFVPHPQVLVALCLCRHRHGEVEEAVQLATTVVPICFERGHIQLAAQVFKQLRREVESLGLNREQILIIGEALAKKGDLAGAGAAYSIAIGRDAGETRAVKGLLQIAGIYMSERAKPDAALKVYEYLLKHCADSPLVEFMREGRTQCERRLSQPVG